MAKGTTEDEMAGWHHGLDGREFEWTLGDGDGQGGLVCCDSWGHKESDMTEQLNWTELNWRAPGLTLHWKTQKLPGGPWFSLRLHLGGHIQREISTWDRASRAFLSHYQPPDPKRNALLTPTGCGGTCTEQVQRIIWELVPETLSQTLSRYDWTRRLNIGKLDSVLIKHAGKTETNNHPVYSNNGATK